MRRLLCILGLLASVTLSAQVYEELDADFRARVSASAEAKLTKGLKLVAGAEFRAQDMFHSADRVALNAGLDYKFCPYFKMGAGYEFISSPKLSGPSSTWKFYHRANLDLTGLYKLGNFNFSLRERFQLTHRVGDMNVYQNPRNLLVLKSRLKVAYKCQSVPLTPSFAVELKTPLNGVHFKQPKPTYEPGDNVSYNDFYLSRVRLAPSLDYRLDYHNSISLSLLADYCTPKSFDAKRDGTLKQLLDGRYAIYYGKSFNTSLCIGYTYIF